MNSRGVGPISMIFSVFVFVVVWIFLSPWISEMGEDQVSINGMSGVEAFVYLNLNFTIFFCLLIMIAAFSYAMRSGGGITF